MAIETPSAAIPCMALVAIMTGVLEVILFDLMARPACDAGMDPGLYVEPERTMGPRPFVLEMAFLAVQSGSKHAVGEWRTSKRAFVAIRTGHGTGNNPKCLEVAMTIPAVQAQMCTLQNKSRLRMIKSGHRPGERSVTGIAIVSKCALMIIRMAAHTLIHGLEKVIARMTSLAGKDGMESEHVRVFMLVHHTGPAPRCIVTVTTAVREAFFMRVAMALDAPARKFLFPAPVALLAL